VHRYLVLLLLPAAAFAQAQPRQIEFGFEQRVRTENWNNIFDWNDGADDERGQVRYRTRAWINAPLTSNIGLSVGLDQETNQIFQPKTVTHLDEVVFETAYIDVKKLFVQGLSLRFGRQNISRGEGFLFLEGNPYDGSRSIYDNAAILAYERKKTKLELMGIWNPRTDHFLPRFNDKTRQLVEWNEAAVGAYLTSNASKSTSVEAYYFYKRESGDRRPVSNPQFQPDRHIYTAGGRTVRKLPHSYSVTGEFAGQWGRQRPGQAIRSWGGYGYLKRNYGPGGRNYVSAGYWALSGTDPAHPETIRNFDPLFSRWPKWSELYIYSQFKEVGVAYWTNTGMVQAEGVYVPWKPLNLRATYYHMNSFHPFAGNQQVFGNGTVRGDQVQGRAELTVNKNWKGHLLYERMAPGSFYRYRSPGLFVRLEITYSFVYKSPF
jgi:hypothetical protein